MGRFIHDALDPNDTAFETLKGLAGMSILCSLTRTRMVDLCSSSGTFQGPESVCSSAEAFRV
jgi:hypothetical protein